MRETRLTMGMPAVLEIISEDVAQHDFNAVFEYFTEVDGRFSTYKEDSEISRINRGEIAPEDYSDAMKEIFSLAAKTKEETDGFFDITTPSGAIDPSGLVKGWAIQRAASLLAEKGFMNFYVEIGGDIQTSGKNAEGTEWSIGIRNPANRDEIVKVVYPHGKGIATSGNYIRGAHIYNPHMTTSSASDMSDASVFSSLSVIGPNVYEADRFATAAFAMGRDGMNFIEALPGFEAYAIHADTKDGALMTSGFDAYTHEFSGSL